ncbi:MAG: hypothetical protein AABX29_01600 [Nanoarchaeota archaeon]
MKKEIKFYFSIFFFLLGILLINNPQITGSVIGVSSISSTFLGLFFIFISGILFIAKEGLEEKIDSSIIKNKLALIDNGKLHLSSLPYYESIDDALKDKAPGDIFVSDTTCPGNPPSSSLFIYVHSKGEAMRVASDILGGGRTLYGAPIKEEKKNTATTRMFNKERRSTELKELTEVVRRNPTIFQGRIIRGGFKRHNTEARLDDPHPDKGIIYRHINVEKDPEYNKHGIKIERGYNLHILIVPKEK